MLRGLEILHDHIDWLPADRHAVGDFWWVHGRFLLFLKLLINEGHGDLPVTRSARRVVTVSALYAELDAVLADYAAHQDRANQEDGGTTGGAELAETLETWRTAKLRHDVLAPPADEEPEAGWPPVPAPWDRGVGAGDGASPRSHSSPGSNRWTRWPRVPATSAFCNTRTPAPRGSASRHAARS